MFPSGFSMRGPLAACAFGPVGRARALAMRPDAPPPSREGRPC
jgi:hypothetical protein